MASKVFDQSIIAVVWDFDKTLVQTYMQKPLFEAYGINEEAFWKETNQLFALYKQKGITVNPDTVYLSHLLTYVRSGAMKGLNNSKLREFGSQQEFFPGLPGFFPLLKNRIEDNPLYKTFDVKLEHYVVSTGLTEVIKGSAVYEHIDGVWGCEFIEQPFVPGPEGLMQQNNTHDAEISGIAYMLDNTTKTRALFEINKGVNKHPGEISVNQSMPNEDRRVPFQNMIYIADGPSDIPAFSVIKNNGGKAYAVYQPHTFRQVKELLDVNRVHGFGPADYSEGTQTYLWIMDEVKEIADRIVKKKKEQLLQGKKGVPGHI